MPRLYLHKGHKDHSYSEAVEVCTMWIITLSERIEMYINLYSISIYDISSILDNDSCFQVHSTQYPIGQPGQGVSMIFISSVNIDTFSQDTVTTL